MRSYFIVYQLKNGNVGTAMVTRERPVRNLFDISEIEYELATRLRADNLLVIDWKPFESSSCECCGRVK